MLVRDITERKQDEKLLKKSEERYRAIFETTGAATVIIEEDTIISLANTQFESLSGFSKGEIEGKKSWTELVTKNDLDRMLSYHKLRRIQPETTPKSYEFKFVDRFGDAKDILVYVDTILNTKREVASLWNHRAEAD